MSAKGQKTERVDITAEEWAEWTANPMTDAGKRYQTARREVERLEHRLTTLDDELRQCDLELHKARAYSLEASKDLLRIAADA